MENFFSKYTNPFWYYLGYYQLLECEMCGKFLYRTKNENSLLEIKEIISCSESCFLSRCSQIEYQKNQIEV